MEAIKRSFETIALAKVSTSAEEARGLGLLSASDRITMNRDRLLSDAKSRALEAGATDFLVKPVSQTEALLRIRNLLEVRRLHVLLENQRSALEEAVRERTAELRQTIAELQAVNQRLPHSSGFSNV